MRILPDALTSELAFYAGTADGYGAQAHQVARLQDDPRFHVNSILGLGYSYIGYNLRRPLFQDVRVRTALGMAIDVDEIIRYVLYRQGRRTTGPYPQQTEYYDPDVKPLPYDPAGAERLLNEAGWRKNAQGILEKDGKPLAFTLITNAGNEERQAIMVIAQNAWRRLGVKVEILTLEWAVFIRERVNKLDFDAVVLGWAMGLDADIFQIFHSSQAGPQQLNFVGYANPRADELMVRIRREYDEARQTAMARELHRLIARDQPYTFLYVRQALSLLDGKIVRMVRRPDGTPQYVPFEPNRLGRINFHFDQWIKTPRPGPASLPARAGGGIAGAAVPRPRVLAEALDALPDLDRLVSRDPPGAGRAQPDRPDEPALHQGAARSATGRRSTSTSRSTSSTGSSTSGCSRDSSGRSRTTSRSSRRSSSARGTASRSSWWQRSWSGASPSRSGSRPPSGGTRGSTARRPCSSSR